MTDEPESARLPLEDLRALFGDGNVVRVPTELVAALVIPPAAKDVLTGVGLPRDSEFFAAADVPRSFTINPAGSGTHLTMPGTSEGLVWSS